MRWTVEIEIADNIVEDGLDLSDPDVVHDMLMRAMPHVYGHEIAVEVIAAPPRAEIRKLQGYKETA